MANSILNETKRLLGVPETDVAFDTDIIIGINSAFMVLNQLGVGPENPLVITDDTTEWSAFSADISKYETVKSYVYLSVRLVFDPPGTSFLGDSLKREKEELGWRLSVQVPLPPTI